MNIEKSRPKVFDKNITIISNDLKLTSSDDLCRELTLKYSEFTSQSEHIVELKKIIFKKYPKHKKEFTNTDNSPIGTKLEFFNAQVRHFKNPKVARIKGIFLSKDHDRFNCSFYLNLETNQLISVREYPKHGVSVGPRTLDITERRRLIDHGIVGQDQAIFKDISWIQHGMTADQIMKRYNLNNNGKLTDTVLDSVEVAKQFSEIMKDKNETIDDNN